jgi:formiminotetrahydrofolate cyclodeaminase
MSDQAPVPGSDRSVLDCGRRSINAYLDQLASNTPAPGGGSAAAIAAALGCALGEMVCQITLNREGKANEKAEIGLVRAWFAGSRLRLVELAGLDETAFPAYLSARRLPRDSRPAREARDVAIRQALIYAARIPLEVAEIAIDAVPRLRIVAEFGTPHALSDISTASHLVRASALGALGNAHINIGLLGGSESSIEIDALRLHLLEQLNDRQDVVSTTIQWRLKS